MKRIMQSTLALAIVMTFSVVTVKAQELEEITPDFEDLEGEDKDEALEVIEEPHLGKLLAKLNGNLVTDLNKVESQPIKKGELS